MEYDEGAHAFKCPKCEHGMEEVSHDGIVIEQNTLFDRRISGSWRESGGKAGVFLGATDPTSTGSSSTTTTTP